jgi:hypothetical protein
LRGGIIEGVKLNDLPSFCTVLGYYLLCATGLWLAGLLTHTRWLSAVGAWMILPVMLAAILGATYLIWERLTERRS